MAWFPLPEACASGRVFDKHRLKLLVLQSNPHHVKSYPSSTWET